MDEDDPLCNIDDDDLNFDLDDTFVTKKQPKQIQVEIEEDQVSIDLFGIDSETENDSNGHSKNIVSSTQHTSLNNRENPFANTHEHSNIVKNLNKLKSTINHIKDVNEDTNSIWSNVRDNFKEPALSIKSYLRKIVRANLLSNANSIEKIPFLNVYIKHIFNRSTNLSITLADDSGELDGVLSDTIVSSLNKHLKVGSVLVLHDLCLLKGNSGYFLNITDRNLVTIVYQSNDAFQKLDLKELHSIDLEGSMQKFNESIKQREDSIRRPQVQHVLQQSVSLKRKISETSDPPLEIAPSKRKFQMATCQKEVQIESSNTVDYSQLIFGIEDVFNDE